MENQHENLTAEELKSRKEEMMRFYKESMPYIKAQLAYEEVLTKIEEQRFKRAGYQYQFAMMMQSPEQEIEQNTSDKPSYHDSEEKVNAENVLLKEPAHKKRKLKTE